MKLKMILIEHYLLYILYNIILLIISFICNRFFQMLMFILFFNSIQNCFNKRFHADTILNDPIEATKCCKIITLIIEILFIIFCKNLKFSIYSNLFIIFFIAFTNCILQYYCEKFIITKSILNDKRLLIEACNNIGLSELSTNRLILKYIEHKTYKEIADLECITEDSIKKSITRSRKKLHI